MILRLPDPLRATAPFGLALVLGSVILNDEANAQVLWSSVDEVIEIDVRTGWREDDGHHVAALDIALETGWKTYWRSAGAAGIPPHFDWSASDNLDNVVVAWPTPSVFRQGDYQSIGYETDFVLPLRVSAIDASKPVTLRGRLDLGVCADICLPAQVDVEAILPVTGQSDPMIQAALEDQPRQIAAPITCVTRPTPDGLALTGEIELPPLGGAEAVVFEIPDRSLWVTDAIVVREGPSLVATSELMAAGGNRITLDTSQVTITVIGGASAVEIKGCRS